MLDGDLILNAGEGAELGLDHDTVIVSVLDDLAGQGDVLVKGLGGGVDHDGGEAAVDAGLAQLEGVAVVQMQGDGDLGILDDGSLDQLHEVGVVRVGTGALGHLEDDGALELAGSFGDALDDFHVVDVEGADGITAVVGFRKHFLGCYERHNTKSPLFF